MSWLFSRALVEAFSAGTCSAGEPSALSSGTPTPQAFWSPGRTTDTYPRFPSGMTCRPLTVDLGAALLTSCLEASHARTSAQPARAQESTASDPACGRTWLGSLARYDRGSCSWRTPQCSLLVGLDVYSETWPRWGTMRGGVCWALLTPVRHMSENASGCLLPMWPTPRVQMGSPTAPTSEGKCRLEWEMVHRPSDTPLLPGGSLNPTWVEWLMGWPLEWTALAPLETDKFRQWQRSHGARLEAAE